MMLTTWSDKTLGGDGNDLNGRMDLTEPGVECMGVQVDQNNRTVSILLRNHACDTPWDFELKLPEYVAAELGWYLKSSGVEAKVSCNIDADIAKVLLAGSHRRLPPEPHDFCRSQRDALPVAEACKFNPTVSFDGAQPIECESISVKVGPKNPRHYRDQMEAALRETKSSDFRVADLPPIGVYNLPPEWKAINDPTPRHFKLSGEQMSVDAVVVELAAEQPVCHGIEPPRHFSDTRCLPAYWETTDIEQPADQREAILARVKADGFFQVERDDVRDLWPTGNIVEWAADNGLSCRMGPYGDAKLEVAK